jgi:PhoPQ-activated pathogenicity-related protein
METLTGLKFISWTWAIFVKNPETGRFLFLLAYILVPMVFAGVTWHTLTFEKKS